jgi:uncharacterized protein (DUF1778 family)
MRESTKNARLNIRLPRKMKRTIEDGAALAGQTVNEFAVSILVRNALDLIQEHHRTLLTNRDRDAFVELLDRTDAKPNKALAAAARKYRKQSA